jgi:predicted transposase/invertase (TIGR01784 family)
MQQGIQQGIQQGDKAGRVETARNMLADGMALETVLKYTGLSAADLPGD